MDILQLFYVIVSSFFITSGLFFFAEYSYILKKIGKYFYFSITCFSIGLFVFCSFLLVGNHSYNFVLIVSKIKFIAFLLTSVFWIVSIYKIYFKSSKVINYLYIITIAAILIITFKSEYLFNNLQTIKFQFLLFSTSLSYLKTGLLYSIFVFIISLTFINLLIKIYSLNNDENNKFIYLTMTLTPLIGIIHDYLVLKKVLDSFFIFEFTTIIFLPGVVFIYLKKQKKRAIRIKNINKELEEKVNDKTKQLSNATSQIWKNYRSLKQAEKLKKEMLQIAAHDLKSPLQGILSYSELLLVQFSDNIKLTDRVNKILNSANDMLNIIGNLLEQEANKLDEHLINLSTCNISDITEYVVDRNFAKSVTKEQKLITKIKVNCIIYSDKDKILEIFDNLISNAIKYSKIKGEIVVSTKMENNMAVVSVKDSGPGFTINDKQLMFKKFMRLTAKPTGNEKSTGLGLFIVKKFVNLLNGEISVNSEEGKGAEFIVQLPNITDLG